MGTDVRNVRRPHAASWIVLLLQHMREHLRLQLTINFKRRAKSEATKMEHFALLLLPVLSQPGDYKETNGFDAPAKKRTRSHGHARPAAKTARRARCMTQEAFDDHCRAIAREEILRTLRMAEALEPK